MQPVGLFRCHPNSSPPHNPSLTNIPVPIGGGVALAYPPPPADVFQHPIGRHVRLPSSPDSWPLDGLPGRLSDAQIAGKHPSEVDRRACRANPLGQPARARTGRTFCNLRTSCGDTNGSILRVAKQVRGFQNPQRFRQAHRKSHLSGEPIFSMAYSTPYLEKQSGNKTTLP